ncbi:GNAT family N-acetyltransferase [Clostridiaceae bacterium]|nr:GNAT family N-acetyltransferase [Clostridiaceae bacterium]
MLPETQEQISKIRQFNRYYTNLLGVLDRHFLAGSLPLPEVRVLHEIGRTPGCTSKTLSSQLQMDAGYFSRILKRLETSGFLEKSPSPEDGRAQCLALTPAGRAQWEAYNRRSNEQIEQLLRPLPPSRRAALVCNMSSIETALTCGKGLRLSDITVRDELRPGDIGAVSALHGWAYREEYGYSFAFEADVAASLAHFLHHYDPGHDRLWCAEHHGQLAGCIGLTDEKTHAQLRWFVLDPLYRGLGLGKQLLQTALEHARKNGFPEARLDTTSDLRRAIGLYEKAGFQKTGEAPRPAWREGLRIYQFSLKL